jgi:DNA repair protein RadB
MRILKLRCKNIDDLLGGGIESRSITEVYGAAGSGKTNLCLQASRECANNNQKIVYINSDNVSGERLKQICHDYDYLKILSNILFFKPTSFNEQEKMIQKSIKTKNLGLIVVDTYNMFYHTRLERDVEGANRSLNRQITNLLMAAQKKDLFIILSGQVYGTKKDDVKPYAEQGIEHILKTIIKLEKVEIGKRQASIIKHRNKSKGEKTFFKITAKGLE